MSGQVIREIAINTKARLAAYWATCLEFNLADHSTEAHAAVDRAVLDAASGAGLDLTRYPGGDPTLPFRNF